ncbi:MAG: hypothetical protein F6K55_39590 [Moorea sp. SIO4A3]|nr:hypothetical protein [Moorena sp. SIO4A3]
MQRGLGEAARSWGSPPLAIAVVSSTRYCIKTVILIPFAVKGCLSHDFQM